ncbi:MAG: hypothetical protein ACWGNV_14460 [Bacteroidales bacterium]
MGRKTYELGYKFGLEPGQLPYPHMKHVIFSRILKFEHPAKGLRVTELDLKIIEELQDAVKYNDIQINTYKINYE